MTKSEEDKHDLTGEVLEAVRAAFEADAVFQSDDVRLAVLHADEPPNGERMVYAVSEEPRFGWLTIVAKQYDKPAAKIVVSGRSALLGVRDAIDRVLASDFEIKGADGKKQQKQRVGE